MSMVFRRGKLISDISKIHIVLARPGRSSRSLPGFCRRVSLLLSLSVWVFWLLSGSSGLWVRLAEGGQVPQPLALPPITPTSNSIQFEFMVDFNRTEEFTRAKVIPKICSQGRFHFLRASRQSTGSPRRVGAAA